MLPFVLTAATAFFGLLPCALSFEIAGSELEAAMAAIVCAGLLTSTTLNLVVVAACCLWRAPRGAARGRGHGAATARPDPSSGLSKQPSAGTAAIAVDW